MVLGFTGIPFISFFSTGILRFYLAMVRKSEIRNNLLLIDYRKYLNLTVLFLLYYFLYVILIKGIEDFSEYEGLMRLRLISGVVLFIWLLSRLIFSPFFVIDKGYTARKALKSSFLLTSGRTIKTFLLISISTFFMLSGMFFFIVGVLYTFSLFMVSFVLAYDINLKNRFSRRKKLIHITTLETKKQIEDTLINIKNPQTEDRSK